MINLRQSFSTYIHPDNRINSICLNNLYPVKRNEGILYGSISSLKVFNQQFFIFSLQPEAYPDRNKQRY